MDTWGIAFFGGCLAIATLIIALTTLVSASRREYVKFLEGRIHDRDQMIASLTAQMVIKDARIDELARQNGVMLAQVLTEATIFKKPNGKPNGESMPEGGAA